MRVVRTACWRLKSEADAIPARDRQPAIAGDGVGHPDQSPVMVRSDSKSLSRSRSTLTRRGSASDPDVVTDDALEALTKLVDDLADPDPLIRDERALSGLARALLGDDPVGDAVAAAVHEYALRASGPLGPDVEPTQGDSVFARSFTIELLAMVHHRDNTSAFLSDEAWNASVAALETAARRETDFRATVPKKGWAHVMAHCSDLADELMAAPRSDPDHVARVLSALIKMVGRSPLRFAGEEEDRVAHTLAGAARRGQWNVSALTTLLGDHDDWHAASVKRMNWKSVVRSLFFRLDEPIDPDTTFALRRLEASLTVV